MSDFREITCLLSVCAIRDPLGFFLGMGGGQRRTRVSFSATLAMGDVKADLTENIIAIRT